MYLSQNPPGSDLILRQFNECTHAHTEIAQSAVRKSYKLDGKFVVRFPTRKRFFLFSKIFKRALGFTQPPTQSVYPASFLQGTAARG
jgi:hypothetical protein